MPACLQLNCLDRFCWRSQIQLEDEGGRNKDVLLETFPRIILDAPDVPTWFFEDTVTTCAGLGIVFLHMFNPVAFGIFAFWCPYWGILPVKHDGSPSRTDDRVSQ